MAVDFAAFAGVLRGLGVPGEIIELPEPAPTAATAAAQLGCAVGAIANSLVFAADEAPLLVMTSGAHRVDTAKVAALLGASAVRRADAGSVRAWTGQAIGGVGPVGHPAPIQTLVDTWLAQYDVIWAAAGHPHTVFPTTFSELVRITGGTPADVGELDPRDPSSGLAPQQRVARHLVAAIPRARKQPQRGGTDFTPGHDRVHNRCARPALVPGDPVEHPCRNPKHFAHPFTGRSGPGQADDGKLPASAQQPGHAGQRCLEVHVVQRRIRADEVKGAVLKRIIEEIRLDERDAACQIRFGPAFLGQRYHPRVAVQAGHFGASRGELAGEHAIPATDVERGAAADRDGTEDDPLEVDVGIPVVKPGRTVLN
jgi:prolyl-tRNA editing enzyme YbaK/EbsC (Cys-tRNA(Pro) deacylase)